MISVSLIDVGILVSVALVSCAVAMLLLLRARPRATLKDAADALATVVRAIHGR